MKVIKKWSNGSPMGVSYDYNDTKLLKDRFSYIDPSIIDKVCSFLYKNVKEIYIEDWRDPQSGWGGIDFEIKETPIKGRHIRGIGYFFDKSTSTQQDLDPEVNKFINSL